ncbi:hypothetical protein EMIT0210MI2_250002 [Priestia megaterium]
MICTYYGAEEENEGVNCFFCGVELNKRRPALKESLLYDDCEKDFYELGKFHTFDLLVLLHLVRKKRTKVYNFPMLFLIIIVM